MKKTVTILFSMCLLVSCGLHDSNTSTATKSQYENTVLVIITDNSKSFARRCPKITGTLLKSTCDKVSKHTNLDVRVGRVVENSDTEFLRYYKQKSSTTESNPWLATEQTETTPQDNWQQFSTVLAQQHNTTPAMGSDIGGALAHALVIFQEYPSNTRKILCIATDYKNTGLSIPAIDPGIEVLNVGALQNVPIEKILKTQNVKRFESMQTALAFITSQL